MGLSFSSGRVIMDKIACRTQFIEGKPLIIDMVTLYRSLLILINFFALLPEENSMQIGIP